MSSDSTVLRAVGEMWGEHWQPIRMIPTVLFFSVIGLTLGVSAESRVIQLLALSVLTGGAILEVLTSLPRRIKKTDNINIIAVGVVSFFWFVDTFFGNSGLEKPKPFSIILCYGLILSVGAQTFRKSRLKFFETYSPLGIGMVVWCCVAVTSTELGLLRNMTEETYGGYSNSLVLGGTREVLSGFPGIISGGIFCALTLIYSFGEAVNSPKWIFRIGFGIASLIAAYGIFITDTRSAMLVAPLGILYILSSRIIRNLRVIPSGIIKKIEGNSLNLAFLFGLCVPFLVPVIESASAILLSFLPSSISVRSLSTGGLTLSGRTEVWEIVLDYIAVAGIQILDFNTIGEYGAGVSDLIFNSGVVPGAAESAHSHNAYLNIYFSVGLFGAFCIIYYIYRIAKLCTVQRTIGVNVKRTTLMAALVLSILVFASLESLFSILYIYFTPILVLLSTEIGRISENNPITASK